MGAAATAPLSSDLLGGVDLSGVVEEMPAKVDQIRLPGFGSGLQLFVLQSWFTARFVHTVFGHNIPGLDDDVACQANCPLCRMGRPPVLRLAVSGIDSMTLALGWLRLDVPTTPKPGGSIEMAPGNRLIANNGGGGIGSQVLRLLRSELPAAGSVIKFTGEGEKRYKARITQIPAEYAIPKEEVAVADRAIMAAQSEQLAALGTNYTVEELTAVPAIQRALAMMSV